MEHVAGTLTTGAGRMEHVAGTLPTGAGRMEHVAGTLTTGERQMERLAGIVLIRAGRSAAPPGRRRPPYPYQTAGAVESKLSLLVTALGEGAPLVGIFT